MTNNTRAVVALLAIAFDQNALMRRRLEAAEGLLLYEAPEEVVEQAKEFLATVFEDYEHVGVEDRLEALKLMRKAEAPRVAQQTIRSANADKDREIGKHLGNSTHC